MNKKAIRYILKIIYLIFLINNIIFIFNILKLNNIENLIRLITSLFIFIVTIILGIIILFKGKKRKTKYNIILLIIIIILTSLIAFINISFNTIYNKISNITNSYTTYSTSLITLSTSKIDSIDDIDNGIIGIINDKNNIDGYILPTEVIKELKLTNKTKKYDTYIDLLNALYDEEVTYIFMPSNYTVNYSNIEKYANIASDTKVLYIKKKQEENNIKYASVTEPFAILLMGVDSEEEGIENSTFNGDSLILVTFNPNTLTTTMLSIPRDTYVPISCFLNDRKNKITHSAWYGEECVMDTIKNFLDIEINYYVKINFKGVVDLVDALGGVDIDVPYNFCEQNSNRQWGDNTIYVEKGFQTLNGEKALAFARNRHPNPEYCSSKWTDYDSNDFIRGENQQIVLKALLEKLKKVRDINTIYELLDTISINMGTNMPTNQILSFYNVAKDIIIKSKDDTIDNIITIKKLKITGYDAMIYDYSMIDNQGMQLELYDFVAYDDSINQIIKAMKENLEIIKNELIKDFSFNINTPYSETPIGSNISYTKSLELLPDFIGEDLSYVLEYANKKNITVNVEYVEDDNSNRRINEVINQSPNRLLDMDYFSYSKGLTVYVVKNITNTTTFDYSICFDKETKDNNKCVLPNFIDKNISTITTYKKYLKDYINFKLVEIKEDDNNYDKDKLGIIISQSIDSNTSLYELKSKTITIKYISEESSKKEEIIPPEDNSNDEKKDEEKED